MHQQHNQVLHSHLQLRLGQTNTSYKNGKLPFYTQEEIIAMFTRSGKVLGGTIQKIADKQP